ncbi:T9SS type A sorting domain-containing protein [Aquimarina litoralis]|uniref:T9SS type A sorting domain-containing protein n=1 Tax=Aquimarina litoralis TaxID=584605 RepID=UPI001C5893DB|nr:T9SS type A sorting domain-containing protein [Aquimarina litoralis]MBW1298827.1 T9SS type A sorting domain-containing protein [Aquimarina litoralis]
MDISLETLEENDGEYHTEKSFLVFLDYRFNAIYVDVLTTNADVFYKILNRNGQLLQENYHLSKRNKISLDPFPSDLYIIEVSDGIHTITKKILRF